MLYTVLIVVLIIALLGGFGGMYTGHFARGPFAYGGVSVGTILLIVLILALLTGRL